LRYFEKLGLLNSIAEEEEKGENPGESTENSSSKFNSLKKKQTRSEESKNYSPIGDIREKQKPERSFELKGYIESQNELLLKVFLHILIINIVFNEF